MSKLPIFVYTKEIVPENILKDFYSSNELRRLIKSKSVKHGANPYNNYEWWIKVGDQTYIVRDDHEVSINDPAYQAEIMFTYMYQIIPKQIDWIPVTDE